MPQLSGQYLGKNLHKFTVAIGGFFITTSIINYLLQDPNKPVYEELKENLSQINGSLGYLTQTKN